MSKLTLEQAVLRLADATQGLSDADVDQPWAWGPHAEGVRFALLGTYHELRDLAVRLADERRRAGLPPTMAQHALAHNHAANRDLQAVLLGVTPEMYDVVPAPSEWQLRYVVAHIVGATRHFLTLVDYALRRVRGASDLPVAMPDGTTDELLGPVDDLLDIMHNYGMPEMLAFYAVLHRRMLEDFVTITDAEMASPSLWWEGIEYDLHHRLQRFDAHLRQHTVQAEKTLLAIGHPPTEARRLLRLVYNALAEVEGVLLGAPETGQAACAALAAQIDARTARIGERLQTVRRLQTAVTTGDLTTINAILDATPELVNAQDNQRLPLILTARYHGQDAVVAALQEAGAALDIWSAAAIGRLDVVQTEVQAEPDAANTHGRDGFTPLQLACFFGHEPTARWLVEQGVDVDAVAQNPTRLRAVHAAAANGSAAILSLLLAAGANPDAAQQRGFTPLHTAADNGNLEMAQLLLAHGADVTAVCESGQTPRDLALAKGHSALAELLR